MEYWYELLQIIEGTSDLFQRLPEHLQEFTSHYYEFIERIARLLSPFATIVAGTYAIYHKWYYAESRLHKRLDEYLDRRESALVETRKHVVTKLAGTTSPPETVAVPKVADRRLGPWRRILRSPLRDTSSQIDNIIVSLERKVELRARDQRREVSEKALAHYLRGALAAEQALTERMNIGSMRILNFEAIEQFDHALRLNPHDLDAREYKAIVRMRMSENVIDELTDIARKSEGDTPTDLNRRRRAWTAIAEMHQKSTSARPATAIKAYRNALKSTPESAPYLIRGMIYLKMGQAQEDCKFLQKAAESYLTAATLLHRSDAQEARQAFKLAKANHDRVSKRLNERTAELDQSESVVRDAIEKEGENTDDISCE